jgi:4-amino-4-deoxy-L-arabinose transferase-like glycosyltransferase
LSATTFRRGLAGITLGAFALRIVYVLVERRDFTPGGDAFFYHAGAKLLADGHGFLSPFFYPARHVQAAEHPPLYMIYLAIPAVLGMHSVLTQLLWSCVAGAATVAVSGLVGREIAGERAGLIGAVLVAVYPNVWSPDGMLEAETLAMLTTMLAVLLAYRYRRAPSWQRLAWCGAACGASALTRSELILLVPFVVLPVAIATPDRSWRDRVGFLGVGVLAAAVVIAPWAIYNSTRFVHPEVLSSQSGPLLAAANCDSTYYGPLQGYFDVNCNIAVDKAAAIGTNDDESQADLVDRRAAFHYIRGHLGRLPTVERIRLQRLVGLYHPSLYVHMDNLIEGRELWISWVGFYSFFALAVLAIAGVVLYERRKPRGPPLFPLLAPIFAVIVTVMATYASTRFRSVAEPSIALLAALAIDALFTRRPSPEPASMTPPKRSVIDAGSVRAT